jgi:hypothetical protein
MEGYQHLSARFPGGAWAFRLAAEPRQAAAGAVSHPKGFEEIISRPVAAGPLLLAKCPTF